MARLAPFAKYSLAIGTIVVFARLFGADWNHWDDDVSLLKNGLLNPPTWESFRYFWRNGFEGLYVPLTQSVWTLVAFIARRSDGALDARYFHATNVLIHALNAVLVFFVLQLFLRLLEGDDDEDRPISQGGAATIGAFVFALHPVQAESVGWIIGLRDLLAGTFGLLTVWAHLYASTREGRRNHRRWSFLAGVAFVLSLLAKPSLAVLPLFLAIVDRHFFHRSYRESAKHFVPWLLCAAIVVGLNAQFQLEKSPSPALWVRPLIAAHALGFYVGKLLVPHPLIFDYGLSPDRLLAQKAQWAFALIPLLLAIVAWKLRRNVPALWVGLVLAGVALLPVSGLVPFAFQYFSTVADHYLYFPLVGVAVIVAALLRFRGTRVARFAAFAALVPLAVLSWHQAGVWRNAHTLFENQLAFQPDSAPAHSNLALVLADENRHTEAIAHLRKVVELRPGDWGPLMNLGTTLIEGGFIDEGMVLLRRTAELAPTSPDALFNLGLALWQQKLEEEARIYFRRVLVVAPGHPMAAQYLYPPGGRQDR